MQFQEQKRHLNIESVVGQTAFERRGKEVSDHEPDHDWNARFFSELQDVSSQDIQLLWSKVLAGEVERPGSTSVRTLSILSNTVPQSRFACDPACLPVASASLRIRSLANPRGPAWPEILSACICFV